MAIGPVEDGLTTGTGNGQQPDEFRVHFRAAIYSSHVTVPSRIIAPVGASARSVEGVHRSGSDTLGPRLIRGKANQLERLFRPFFNLLYDLIPSGGFGEFLRWQFPPKAHRFNIESDLTSLKKRASFTATGSRSSIDCCNVILRKRHGAATLRYSD